MNKKKILIADDDNMVNDILKLLFEGLGDYEVIQAYNGLDAVESTKAHHPDLIIMDYMMPEMNGWEATVKIKEIKELSSIPVVGYTAYATIEHVRAGIKAGIAEVITKPFDTALWEAKILQYLI